MFPHTTRLFFLLLTLCAFAAGGCSQSPTFPHARFIADNGGLLQNTPDLTRAQRALARINTRAFAPSRCALSIHLLNSHDPAAWSFPDGSIFLSNALVSQLSDDELAACIAHELGHLLHDGILHAPFALLGPNPPTTDLEHAADLLAIQVLKASHIPPSALPSALQKVANASRGTYFFVPLCDRIRSLRAPSPVH
ncbi:MAG: M48 family metalloprotease [Phycisphaerae bacterium]